MWDSPMLTCLCNLDLPNHFHLRMGNFKPLMRSGEIFVNKFITTFMFQLENLFSHYSRFFHSNVTCQFRPGQNLCLDDIKR